MTTTLNPQSRVPDLTVPLVGGGEFSIHDTQPKAFNIIVVYRGLHCPKCKAQLKDIEDNLDALKEIGCDVIAISMDSKDKAQQAKDEWGLSNLRIGYGLSIQSVKEYGLFLSDAREGSQEPKHFAEPGLFVVDPDGALYALYIQNTPFGRPAIADITAGLEFVMKNNYPVRGTSVA